jgi:hypothetical protein
VTWIVFDVVNHPRHLKGGWDELIGLEFKVCYFNFHVHGYIHVGSCLLMKRVIQCNSTLTTLLGQDLNGFVTCSKFLEEFQISITFPIVEFRAPCDYLQLL